MTVGGPRLKMVKHCEEGHRDREREHGGKGSTRQILVGHGVRAHHGEVNDCCELGHNKFEKYRKATQWGLEQGRERDSALEEGDAGSDELGQSRLEKPRGEREMGLVYQKWMVGG
ncbi:Uncharacterized protein Adt_16866 [Abeliophyllum distichum]|uniref:Uncharacterized protein n=1 Tax=Abeliophyllum distichum TaxID=126358 RepID=A0ABD1TEV4_9LAMI